MITRTAGPTVVGTLDPVSAWDGHRLLGPGDCEPGSVPPIDVCGPLASAAIDASGRVRLMRDPLGLAKLFWARSADGELSLASRPVRLVEAGLPFDSIRAIPPGTAIDVHPLTGGAEVHRLCGGRGPGGRPDALEDIAAGIRDGLERYMALLARAHDDAQVFVCTSGGLDSSAVAVLAREHFRDVVAVSFDLRRCGRPGSEDRRVAQRLARDLGLLFLAVTTTVKELLEPLDPVLAEGIDWRDFNVHAAMINAALARGIAEAAAPDRPVLVLTGDLPNELLADYAPESHGARTYYRLPRVPMPALRDFLVRGLDTSNREIGPFGACGIPVALPYAAVVDRFLALPDAFLSNPRRKADLARLVFGARIPDYVYARPKVRAQIGDSAGGGVLAACIDAGLTQPVLRDRFARLHGLDPATAGPILDRFIRCGRYRSGIPALPEEDA